MLNTEHEAAGTDPRITASSAWLLQNACPVLLIEALGVARTLSLPRALV